MEHDLRRILLETATAFAAASPCALSTVSRRCKNDPNFFDRLKDTSKSFTIRTYDEVMGWFMENWPAEHQRPIDLLRWAAEYARSKPEQAA